jgi:hypothetical protein
MHITRRRSSTFVALICCIVCAALGIYYGLSQQGSISPKNATAAGGGAFNSAKEIYIDSRSAASSAPPQISPEPVPSGASRTPHPTPIPTPLPTPHSMPRLGTSGTAHWARAAGGAAFVRPAPEAGQPTTTATATF